MTKIILTMIVTLMTRVMRVISIEEVLSASPFIEMVIGEEKKNES